MAIAKLFALHANAKKNAGNGLPYKVIHNVT